MQVYFSFEKLVEMELVLPMLELVSGVLTDDFDAEVTGL
jgi:hypothetical protein